MQVNDRGPGLSTVDSAQRPGPDANSFANLLRTGPGSTPGTSNAAGSTTAVTQPLVARSPAPIVVNVVPDSGVYTDPITEERTPIQREGRLQMTSPRLGGTPVTGETFVGRNAPEVEANSIAIYGNNNRLVGGENVPNSLAVGGSGNTLVGGDAGNYFVPEPLPLSTRTGSEPSRDNTFIGGRGNDSFRDPHRGTVWFGGGTNIVTGLGSSTNAGGTPWQQSVDEALSAADSVSFNRGLPDDPSAAQGERNILDVSVYVEQPRTPDGQVDRAQYATERAAALDAYADGLEERGLIGPNGVFDEVRVRTGTLGSEAVITTSPSGEVEVQDAPR